MFGNDDGEINVKTKSTVCMPMCILYPYKQMPFDVCVPECERLYNLMLVGKCIASLQFSYLNIPKKT